LCPAAGKPHNLGLFVDNGVNKIGILVCETVVILPPDVRGQQVIQQGDLPPSWEAQSGFQPLCMLVEHRINNVNECLITTI
jgi:hypothetical protein